MLTAQLFGTGKRMRPLPDALALLWQAAAGRAEIEAAFGILLDDAPWIHRERVLWHELSQTDLLFVTLNKSEALLPLHPLPRQRRAMHAKRMRCE
jgi:hypothetical protein